MRVLRWPRNQKPARGRKESVKRKGLKEKKMPTSAWIESKRQKKAYLDSTKPHSPVIVFSWGDDQPVTSTVVGGKKKGKRVFFFLRGEPRNEQKTPTKSTIDGKRNPNYLREEKGRLTGNKEEKTVENGLGSQQENWRELTLSRGSSLTLQGTECRPQRIRPPAGRRRVQRSGVREGQETW